MLRITVKEKPTFKKRRDNYARRLKTQKLIKYLQSELRTSTTHGLPYIANTEIHWFERIFWAACFGISCAIIFVLLSAQYTRLVEQPIVNSVEKDYLNWNVSYPAIVLCPVTKIDNEMLTTYVNKWSDSSVAYAKNNIELSVHDIDFFVQLVNYASAYKVYTLSPDEIILSGTPALTFETEGFLSFGVQITSTRASEDLKYIPLHLRKCRFTNETSSKRYPIYSYNRCLLDCRIRMIFKLCDCIPHFYKPLDHERICNLAELECVFEYKKEIMKLSIGNETIGKFENMDDLPRSFRDCGCLGNCEEDVFKNDRETFLPQVNMNRLRVSVYAFPKVRVMREIIFSFYDVFLRSGGVVNLCIGTSVISIMELILTALRIPIYEIMQIAKGVWRRYKRSKLPRLTNNKKQM
ncbi:hypothetical protein PYW07_002762 [Mythimna separata]|uniref:Sodium channel protein Nach n=1 Tax=Mythimna separata TaxID=271217 RepID=A0AAD7YGH5_MYTSE|nr:hypothetical protein PYW07_002762 [Mythimna separata]